MKDPHLQSVRTAHRLRVGGSTWAQIACKLGVSIPTARARVNEWHERRQAGTLFTDLDATMEEDLYAHPSLDAGDAR